MTLKEPPRERGREQTGKGRGESKPIRWAAPHDKITSAHVFVCLSEDVAHIAGLEEAQLQWLSALTLTRFPLFLAVGLKDCMMWKSVWLNIVGRPCSIFEQLHPGVKISLCIRFALLWLLIEPSLCVGNQAWQTHTLSLFAQRVGGNSVKTSPPRSASACAWRQRQRWRMGSRTLSWNVDRGTPCGSRLWPDLCTTVSPIVLLCRLLCASSYNLMQLHGKRGK